MKPGGPFDFAGSVEVVAHRGFSARAPENTLRAMEAAIDAGAHALEFDVHPASDGTPMLIHDDTLERTTDGHGRVDEHTPDALAHLDAGSWFGAGFAGEAVPRLEDALAATAGRVERAYTEIKSHRGERDLEVLVAVVRSSGLADRTVYISMDWEALESVRHIDSDASIGYIVERADHVDEGIARAIGDEHALLDFDQRILLGDPSIARRVTDAGIPLAAWTVNSVAEAEALVSMGCPRIATNEVETLVAWATER